MFLGGGGRRLRGCNSLCVGQVGLGTARQLPPQPRGCSRPFPCSSLPVQISGCHALRTKGFRGSGAAPGTLTLHLPCAAVPSAPGRVLASRNTRTSVVVQWDRPKHEEDLLGYYVDCCVAGSNAWEPCNHKPIGYNRCGGPRAAGGGGMPRLQTHLRVSVSHPHARPGPESCRVAGPGWRISV